MKLLNFSPIPADVGLSTASKSTPGKNNHKWIAPKPTDLRSPCPGLNTLANHGYLPRDGRNISISMMLKAAIDGFNVGSDAILQAAKVGLLSGDDPTTLNLDALKLHSLIEHDASASRSDFALGDNLHFNETIFTTLANANPGVDYYNATSAGLVQRDRLAISLATNPNITNTPKEFLIRVRESGLYQSVIGNPLTGIAPKKSFLGKSACPWAIAEGWKRPTTTITAETLSPIGHVIEDNSDWTPTQQCEDLVLGPNLTI